MYMEGLTWDLFCGWKCSGSLGGSSRYTLG